MAVALFADLDVADHALGGKARSLAQLRARGLPTPRGFVITDRLFRAVTPTVLPKQLEIAALDAAATALRAAPWPDGFAAELTARLDALGAARLSVRSSFAGEDDPAALAPGVFESRVDVPRAEVESAIRDVLASAISPAAVAYACARGREPAAPPVAVLIHHFVPGEAVGAAAIDAATLVVSPRAGRPSSGAAVTLERTLRTLAAALGPVEVEWVASGDTVTFLQMRPYHAPPPPPAWAGLADLAPSDRMLPWRWDAVHNPLPLSPAQAGLVSFVDERCRIGLRQRVLAGYLFWAPGAAPPPIDPGQVPAAFAALRDRVLADLAALPEAPPLPAALDLFVRVYEPLFGVIQPAARRGRARLESWLRAHAPSALMVLPALLSGVPSAALERRQLAGDRTAYLTHFGDEAPAWDVSVPTYREAPERFPGVRLPAEDAAAWDRHRATVMESLPAPLRRGFEDALAVARACAAVLEDDDWLYARLQAVVRRALLGVGRQLVLTGALDHPDDVFFWPLPLVASVVEGAAPPPDGRAIAAAARAACERARRDPPVGAVPARAEPVAGHGTGGRAIGPVIHHVPGGPAPPPDAVLVAATLLPTELPLLAPAALVTETGGPLDHVAAQARERRLPAVVGAPGATALRPGELVLVDGDRGLVIPIGRRW